MEKVKSSYGDLLGEEVILKDRALAPKFEGTVKEVYSNGWLRLELSATGVLRTFKIDECKIIKLN